MISVFMSYFIYLLAAWTVKKIWLMHCSVQWICLCLRVCYYMLSNSFPAIQSLIPLEEFGDFVGLGDN